jgi:hypothetical protein
MLHTSRDITISGWIGIDRKWVVERHGNLLPAVWFAVKFDYLIPATPDPMLLLQQRGYVHQIEVGSVSKSLLYSHREAIYFDFGSGEDSGLPWACSTGVL